MPWGVSSELRKIIVRDQEVYMEEISGLELAPQMNKQDFCKIKVLKNTPYKETKNVMMNHTFN